MSNFDWKIWITKLGKKLLLVFVIGGLVEIAAYLGTEPVPSEYVWLTVIGIE